MQESTARSRLITALANSADPILADSVLLDLLLKWRDQDQHGRRPDPYHQWVAQTAYSVGDIVVSTKRGTPPVQSQLYGPNPNGPAKNYCAYTCTTAGTSDATEPAWPEDGATGIAEAGPSTLVWGYLMPVYWRGRWNINAAASEGWLYKAGLLAQNYGLTVAGSQLQRDQAFKHAMEMATYFLKRSGLRSIRLGAMPDHVFQGPDIPAWEGYFTDQAPPLLPYLADGVVPTYDNSGDYNY